MASSNLISAGNETALRVTGVHCAGAGSWRNFSSADRSARPIRAVASVHAETAENCHSCSASVEVVARRPSHGGGNAKRSQPARPQRRLIAGLTAAGGRGRLDARARGVASPFGSIALSPGVASASRQTNGFQALACPHQCLNDPWSGLNSTNGPNGSGPAAVLANPTNGVRGAGAAAPIRGARTGSARASGAEVLQCGVGEHQARAPFVGAKRPSCSRQAATVNASVQTLVDKSR